MRRRYVVGVVSILVTALAHSAGKPCPADAVGAVSVSARSLPERPVTPSPHWRFPVESSPPSAARDIPPPGDIVTLTRQWNVLRARENEQGQEVSQLMGALQQARVAIVALQNLVDEQGRLLQSLPPTQEALKSRQVQVAQLQDTVTTWQQAALVSAEALTTKTDAMVILQNKLDASERALVAATLRRIPSPGKANEVRDYAIGTALADDMLALLKARAASGIVVDKTLALAGVQDTFSGSRQVPDAVLRLALVDSSITVEKRLQEQKNKAMLEGARYWASFARQADVKTSPEGFLYRIDYAGLGAIADTDSVALVITESLPDGTVVSDMDALGTYVSQPLADYPPLFQKAIRLMANHGVLTLVVPPALAYGEAGSPPRVPPDATLVYRLRIRDVFPVSPGAGK